MCFLLTGCTKVQSDVKLQDLLQVVLGKPNSYSVGLVSFPRQNSLRLKSYVKMNMQIFCS